MKFVDWIQNSHALADVILPLFLKVTIVVLVALVLDFLLPRRYLLACSAVWNGAIALLAVLPLACLMLPAQRLQSTSRDNHSALAEQALNSLTTPTEQTTSIDKASTDDQPPEVPSVSASVPGYVTQADPVPASPVAPTLASPSVAVSATAVVLPTPAAVLVPARFNLISWFWPALVATYALGLVVMVARLLISMLAVARLRWRSQGVVDSGWQNKLALWHQRCRLSMKVDLRHSSDVTVPIVVGLRRPAIILPTDLASGAEASDATQDAILVHELAHIARRDFAWQLLQRIEGAVLWFHPLVWLAHRRVGLARERVCDAFAVYQLGRDGNYLETLLTMAMRLTRRSSLSLGLAVLRTSQLGERLASVHNSPGIARCQARPGTRWAILSAVVLAAAWVGRAAIAEEPLPQAPGLPEDAKVLVTGFQERANRLRAEVDERVAAERTGLEKSLQDLQENYTKAGKLDEAVAVRDQLRLLKGTAYKSKPLPPHSDGHIGHRRPSPQSPNPALDMGEGDYVPPAPPSPTEFRQAVGRTFFVKVVGSKSGSIWGTDEYTDDSSIATAAVHAGVLQPGEEDIVQVTVCPGLPSYKGSARNGVTSSDWHYGAGYVSLKIEKARSVDDAAMSSFVNSVGQTFYFKVTGKADGSVWGTDEYTHDSSIPAAAVHAGALSLGETGMVKVTVCPGLPSYHGSTQHGVTSRDWPSGNGYVSLKIERAPRSIVATDTASTPSTEVSNDPGSMSRFSNSVGQSFSFRVTGSTSGAVWGTDVYTHDSSLAAAAVHAGVLAEGKTGVVKVTMLPSIPVYHGSTHNGVTSHDWQNGGSYISYKIEDPNSRPPQDTYWSTRELELSYPTTTSSGAAAPSNGGPPASKYALPR